ncbi:hypothetical protein BH10ACT1_BH10ACT1_08440 [soil metagenome]
MVEPGVAERGFEAAVPAGGGLVGGDGVDGPFDALQAAFGDLPAERVREGFDRVRVVDDVAVVVEPGVDRPQGERTVTAEQGAAGLAQGATADGASVGLGRRDGAFAHGGWSAALVVGDPRPELLAPLVDAGEGFESTSGELVHLAVDLVELGEELVSLDLEGDPPHAVDLRPAAAVGQAHAGDARRRGRVALRRQARFGPPGRLLIGPVGGLERFVARVGSWFGRHVWSRCSWSVAGGSRKGGRAATAGGEGSAVIMPSPSDSEPTEQFCATSSTNRIRIADEVPENVGVGRGRGGRRGAGGRPWRYPDRRGLHAGRQPHAGFFQALHRRRLGRF